MPAIELYPYQRKWLACKGRFKIGMFARQTGKTFTSTLDVVNDCMEAESEGRRTRWVILSRGERQAKEAMQEGIQRHLQAYGIAFDAYEYDFDPKTKALEVLLPGGSRITALPANPDTARGFSANVLLDEFAFHQRSHEIWRSLFPVISAGWRLIVISTPNGKQGKFYELMSDDDPAWYRQTVDIYQAVADGLPRNVEELRRGMKDPDGWAQEFELQWLDEASAWLSFDLISSVEHAQAGLPELYTGEPCFLGIDIGLRNDLWVCWVLELLADVLWTREIVELHRVKFAEHDFVLDRIMRDYAVARACMDQTGMGEKPVEDAKRRYGEHIIEGVIFTGPNKLVMATAGKQTCEDRRVRIPAGSQVLREDMHKLRKVTSPTGAPRFVAERDGAGHADRTWALFLGINAAGSGVAPIDFQALGKPRVAFIDEPSGGSRITDVGFGTVRGRCDFRGY